MSKMFSGVRGDVLANFGAQSWLALLSLAAIPIYVTYLGPDAYGLLALLISIQAIAGVLDLGLTATASREMARRNAEKLPSSATSVLVRTLEVVFGLQGLVVAVGLAAMSGWIGNSWVTPGALSPDVISKAILIFGVSLGIRWPVGLYSGILRGLEQHKKLSLFSSIFGTTRVLVSIGIVTLVAPSIILLLEWQLILGVVELGILAWMTWKALPASENKAARFSVSELQKIWKFSLSVSATSLFAAVLKQVDKILISKLLSLEALGYYAVATGAINGVQLIIGPVFQAVYPRLSALVAGRSTESLARMFHTSASIVAFATAPILATLIFFPHEVLMVWTHSETVASQSSVALGILAFATLLNANMQVPYALQLASGLAVIPLLNNAIWTVVLVPTVYFLVNAHGIAGGAIGWAIFNSAYFLLTPHVTHRFVLTREKWSWYFKDTLPFMVTATLILWVAAEIGSKLDLVPLVGLGVAGVGILLYGIAVLAFGRPAMLCSRVFGISWSAEKR